MPSFELMRKYILLLFLTPFCLAAISQVDTAEATYKKSSSFPDVKLLLPDSVSYYTKEDIPGNTAVMLILFNPTCEHCLHETEEILKNIDRFSDKEILMVTSMPFDSMRVFREKYKLAQYKNIVVAQDTHFFLISYFMIHRLPFLAFYNRKKELISVFDGSMPVDKALEELSK